MGIVIWVLSCIAVYMLRNENISETSRYTTLGVAVFVIVAYLIGSAIL